MASKNKMLLKVEVVRKSDELGIIWGYATVAGVEDLQGDTLPDAELVPAVYEFMENYYAQQATIKDNHGEPAEAVLVESTIHYLGCALRWYVGVKLLSEKLRTAARAGEISGFSVGGWAEEGAEDGNA
jgi:hypothetical protein